jgi:hypothetical protein
MSKARLQITTAIRVQDLFRSKEIREPDPSNPIKVEPALAGLLLFGLLPLKRWAVPTSLGTAALHRLDQRGCSRGLHQSLDLTALGLIPTERPRTTTLLLLFITNRSPAARKALGEGV